MIIVSLTLILSGILLILHSSAISGRVLSPDDIFNEGGLKKAVIHILTASPFAGYKQDIRILIFGLLGVVVFYFGIGLLTYVVIFFYMSTGTR